MEIREVSSLEAGAHDMGDGATITPLYPSAAWGQGLVAVDLWEIAPGGSLARHAHPEEHILFVLSGQGRLMGEGQNSIVAAVHENTVIYLAPHEAHRLRNTGSSPLRVVVSTPLLVRSDRAAGVHVPGQAAGATPSTSAARPDASDASPRLMERPAITKASHPAPEAEANETARPSSSQSRQDAANLSSSEEEHAPANISGIVRRASELKDQPTRERRKPSPPHEEAPQPEEQSQADESDEEAEEQSNLMELFVAFDGGTRGNTAQGFGRYLVQAPGRKPIVKAAEFDANYSPALAQYESLIEALRYIAARLEATGRTPQQVQLDIRSDNENVVNGLLGTMKVKEPALRKRQEQALELLGSFADWRIEWHSSEEGARLLG